MAGAQAAESGGFGGGGEPCQRGHGVAEQVAAVAVRFLDAVDEEAAGHGGEVDGAPVGRGGGQHGRGVVDLIGDQSGGADRFEVAGGGRAVAVFDDFDGGEDLAGGGGGAGLVAGAGRQVISEADGDFALDAGVAEGGPGEGRGASVQVGVAHEAGGGAGEAEIVLHALGGGADFEAGGGDGAPAGGQRVLGGDGLGEGCGRHAGRQRPGGGAGGAGGVQQFGDRFGVEGHRRAPRLCVEPRRGRWRWRRRR